MQIDREHDKLETNPKDLYRIPNYDPSLRIGTSSCYSTPITTAAEIFSALFWISISFHSVTIRHDKCFPFRVHAHWREQGKDGEG